MLERCGLGPQIALVSGENARITEALKEFERVASANSDAVDSPLQIESSTALASLCISCSDAGLFQKRCKCSNADRELVEFIVRHREVAMTQPNDVRLFKHMILDLVFLNGQDQMEISRNKCQELLKYTGSDENTRRTITEWEIDVFPANGIDLMRVNVERGPRMRSVLAHLYNIWKKSDLKASKDELLGHVNDSEIDEIEIGKSKKRKRISKSPPKTDSTLPKT
jgi:hypothetical protein